MLEYGSARKYILYAIGEIALVVIGILIALQINNWNQDRLDRQKEKAVIQTIHQEAIDNLSYVNFFADRFIIPKREALKILLDDKNELSMLSKEEMIGQLATALTSPVFVPRFVLSQRILKSDDFDLIQLDSLKQIVLKLHNSIEQTQEAYKPIKNQDYWESYVNNNLFNVDVIKSISQLLNNDFDGVRSSSSDNDFVQILKDKKGESIISVHLFFTGIMVRRLDELKDLSLQLIALIEDHYKIN